MIIDKGPPVGGYGPSLISGDGATTTGTAVSVMTRPVDFKADEKIIAASGRFISSCRNPARYWRVSEPIQKRKKSIRKKSSRFLYSVSYGG